MRIKTVLLFLGLLTLTSIMCGQLTSPVSNKTPSTSSQNTNSPTLQSVPATLVSPSSAPRENPSGSIPQNLDFSTLPSDIPVLGNITYSAQQDIYLYVYISQTNFDEAIAFYKSHLPQNGWNEFRTVPKASGAPGVEFYYEKSNRRIAINLSSKTWPDTVIVGIYTNGWILQPCDMLFRISGTTDGIPADIPMMGDKIGFCSTNSDVDSSTGNGYVSIYYYTVQKMDAVKSFYESASTSAGWSLTHVEDYSQPQDSVKDFEYYFQKPGRQGVVYDQANDQFLQAPLGFMKVVLFEEGNGDTKVNIYLDAIGH